MHRGGPRGDASIDTWRFRVLSPERVGTRGGRRQRFRVLSGERGGRRAACVVMPCAHVATGLLAHGDSSLSIY
jgi:hypothetical protein